jgi:hypothetical protein
MRAPAPDALIWHRRDALDLASASISLTEAIMSAMRRTSLLHSGSSAKSFGASRLASK